MARSLLLVRARPGDPFGHQTDRSLWNVESGSPSHGSAAKGALPGARRIRGCRGSCPIRATRLSKSPRTPSRVSSSFLHESTVACVEWTLLRVLDERRRAVDAGTARSHGWRRVLL